ncbi:FxSxx-COOH system tetratricopeptide repeat protein [Candidatus Protofrankia californiensis]|uniref:FxSxx-COOH system tetratricopeptide repeat protein n=1 Tax=Candidatus Protofrankia californiensis TaxID=1839754 RepID=UPI0013EB492A|nr:FxSxx-COOH system tetratricopeptide repeat protein [Candidatus Protofrankia californiensis]
MDDPGGPGEAPPTLDVDARGSKGVQIVLAGGSGVQNNYFAGRQPVRWPHLVGVIPPRTDGFQDRAVTAVLNDHAGVGRVSAPTQIVAGLGGVGKTQLAAEFARRMWAAGVLDLLVWVSAGSRAAVVSAYAQAAADLVLGPDDEDQNQTAMRFLAWLGNTDKRWLIVLDDVNSAGDVRGLWPPERPDGRTVVTTRRRDAALLAGRDMVKVGVFTEQEAIDYLTGKLPSGLADDVQGVAADLGLLPLALGHAAAYMLDQDLTCTAYRRRFADRSRRLSGLFPDESGLFDGTADTVATTWSLSIEAADQLAPIGMARPLLELASVLDPNGIPETLFATEAVCGYLARQRSSEHEPSRPEPPHLETAEIAEVDVRDGLRALHRFHLVVHDAGLIRVHALVQRAVREDVSEPLRAALATSAADALIHLWPDVDLDARYAQLLRTNATTLHRVVPEALWATAGGAHPVLPRVARSFGDAALLSDAISFSREISDEALRHLGAGHRDTLAFRNQLAMWLGDDGQVEDAVASLEALVADAVSVLGTDDPNTLDARQNLGYQRGQAGDPAEAAADLTAVLADRERVLGPDHPTALTTADQLAYWRGKAGDAAGAVALLSELLPNVVRVRGPEHRDTLAVRGNIAWWIGEAGDPVGAVAAMREALADTISVLGAEHRDMSVLRNNLAYWQGKAGDPAGAAAALEKLLVDRLRMFGPDHRDTQATRNALAELHVELDNPAEAAAQLELVLAARRWMFGDDHPETLDTRYRLACVRGKLGDPAEVVAALEGILNEQSRVLGPDHRATARTRDSLAHWREIRADGHS